MDNAFTVKLDMLSSSRKRVSTVGKKKKLTRGKTMYF